MRKPGKPLPRATPDDLFTLEISHAEYTAMKRVAKALIQRADEGGLDATLAGELAEPLAVLRKANA